MDRNDYNGYIKGVNWQAVDILLRREKVKVKPTDFSNWRMALNGYIEAVNECIEQRQSGGE
ncbi:MAG: hypothetical protein KGV51_06710 [Moraxellaceae bacterium]|nr:hypothetical protein [Moraxellaceae bacterium]